MALHTRLRVALCLAILSVVVPVRARAAAPADSADRQADIRELYQRLTTAVGGARESLSVALDDFRELPPETFSSTRMLDVLTLPEGDVIEVSRQVWADDPGGVRVSYRVAWGRADESWKTVDSGPAAADVTLAGMLGILEAQTADIKSARVEQLISFRVRAALAGRQREYRALALRVRPAQDDARGPSRLWLLDSVIRHMNDVAADRGVPLAEPGRPEPETTFQNPPRPCVDNSATPTLNEFGPYSQTDDNQHILGRHKVKAAFSIACSCNSLCVSRCEASIKPDSYACNDNGVVTSASHTPFVGNSSGPAAVAVGWPASTTAGAACEIAYACRIKACLFGLCGGGGFSVSADGIGGVEFNPPNDPDAVWQWGFSAKVTCNACQVQPQPPPRKKRARKPCPPCSAGAQASAITPTSVAPCGVLCEDAPEGEPGYDTCEEAIAAEPDPVCPGPCPNGTCDAGETCSTCPLDCGFCGPVCFNGICEPGETCSTCPADCGSCGPTCHNGICEFGENQSNCCDDCGCPANYECGLNGCTCGTVITEDCGNFFDVCGNFHDLGPCPTGETCVSNHCQPSGGGGGGGGGGGSGCCDSDGDGWVTENECLGCCGGWIDGGFCIVQVNNVAQSQAASTLTLRIGAPNPVPTVMSLAASPAPASAAKGFTLTVDGKLFVPGSTVKIAGVARATTFVSATRLLATVPAGGVPSGSQPVSVVNPAPGGGTGNAVSLSIAK